MDKEYSGKLLWINLTDSSIKTEDISKYKEWIGGRALGAYLLSTLPELYSNEVKEQPIIITSAPLVGSGIPLAVRTAVTARSQITHGFCYSNVGGDFGLYMRQADFDGIVIRGSSETPVYLLLNNGEASLEPADKYWGKQITPLREALISDYGNDKLSYIAIGPAGENQVPLSNLMVDLEHAAGWGGSGWIFGSKKLKAIVALGGSKVKFFDPDGLKRKSAELNQRIIHSPAMKQLIKGGTHWSVGAGGYTGKMSTSVRNAQDEFLTPEETKLYIEPVVKQWEIRRVGCLGCPIACIHEYEMDSKQYGKFKGRGMHANSVRGVGENLGIDTPDAIFAIHLACNEYGLDVDGTSAAMAFALECAEKGILEKEQPGSVKLEWGDGPSLLNLVQQMADREGLGDVICRGAYEAAKIIGKGSEKYALTVKKAGINEAGLRSLRSWMLGYVTATRGGGHLGGASKADSAKMSTEFLRETFGIDQLGNAQSYENKGKIAAWTEGLKAAVDSLGLCYFTYGWYDVELVSLDEMAELYYLATGIELSGDDLQKVGFRIHDLERYLSYVLGGFTREDDTLPDRYFDGPVSKGPNKGDTVDKKKLKEALNEYYETLGWDINTGLPKEDTLRKEGLGHIIRE